MINAGAEVLGFDGSQSFNETDSRWEGVKIRVHYPSGQNHVDNPVSADDYLIEPNGNVWTVVGSVLTHTSTDTFTVTLTRLFADTTEEESPQFGQVSRGAILTPRKGVVAPYWSSTLVAAEVARIGANVSGEINERDNTADVDKPVSMAVQAALDGKLNISALTNSLTDDDPTKALSASAGKSLQDQFDVLTQDIDMVALQNAVDFIEANRADLENLSVNNIAGLDTALAGKVDKVSGKGLSANDYTGAEKSKLAGIEAEAQKNVGTDLGVSRSGNQVIVTSSTGSNVTLQTATTSEAGVLTADDKVKLNSAWSGDVDLGTLS